MKQSFRFLRVAALILALVMLTFTLPAMAADDFFLYGNQGLENVKETNIPPITGGWSTAVDIFRDGPHKGKMLVANNQSVFIQETIGSDTWIEVAIVDAVMDPAFIKISPSGQKVALGRGYQQSIMVFSTSLLNSATSENPVDLSDSDQVFEFDENYFDAAWVGEDYLVINGGYWVLEGVTANSAIVALDVRNAENEVVPVTYDIIDAGSSSIAVDDDFNIYCGVGYHSPQQGEASRTGELILIPASSWWSSGGPTGVPVHYESPDNLMIANNVLSSAHLGFDSEGNLHVGGGQFMEKNPDELGFAALISKRFLDKARAYIANPGSEPFDVLDESRGSFYREFQPDPCGDDTATGILAGSDELIVLWNSDETGGGCLGTANDFWQIGTQPVATTYKIDETSDADNDGFLDVADWSPYTYHSENTDTDNDGYGNIIDADFNNDGIVDLAMDFQEFVNQFGSTDPNTDMNSDGIVNHLDFSLFVNQYRKVEPYFNF